MKTGVIGLTFIGLAMLVLTSCSKISEPWDTRDYFKQERARGAEQQQALRQRLFMESDSRRITLAD